MLQVYGIPNCQTVKKARVWLEEHAVDYTFHNFKTEAPTAELLQTWLQSRGLGCLGEQTRHHLAQTIRI
jgi:arsenate reductase